jgi:hypothetical protein
MCADFSFYVKSIATCAPTFLGYIISVLASVSSLSFVHKMVGKKKTSERGVFNLFLGGSLPPEPERTGLRLTLMRFGCKCTLFSS